MNDPLNKRIIYFNKKLKKYIFYYSNFYIKNRDMSRRIEARINLIIPSNKRIVYFDNIL